MDQNDLSVFLAWARTCEDKKNLAANLAANQALLSSLPQGPDRDMKKECVDAVQARLIELDKPVPVSVTVPVTTVPVPQQPVPQQPVPQQPVPQQPVPQQPVKRKRKPRGTDSKYVNAWILGTTILAMSLWILLSFLSGRFSQSLLSLCFVAGGITAAVGVAGDFSADLKSWQEGGKEKVVE